MFMKDNRNFKSILKLFGLE